MAKQIEILTGNICPDCGTTNGCTITRPEYDGDGAYYCGNCGAFMPCKGHKCPDEQEGNGP